MEINEVLGNVDALDIMGYAPFSDQNRLMGAVEQLPEEQKKKAYAKILAPKFGGANLDNRDKAMQRLGALPADIRSALVAKRLQLVDSEYYSVKALSTQTNVRFFEDADTMLPGRRNISNGKMIKDVYFLCTHVQFLMGFSTVVDPTLTPSDCFFDSITADNSVANGEFEFRANGNKYMLPKDSPLSMFSDVQFGGLKESAKMTRALDNPKWLEPQVGIEFNIRCAAAVSTPAGGFYWGKFKMIGVSVINY